MSKPQYLRHKRAKGRDYWYFDTGTRTPAGKPILSPLPAPKSPSFGAAYARAQAARTTRANKSSAPTLENLIRAFEKSPEFRSKAESTKRSYLRYLEVANGLIRSKTGESPPLERIEKKDVIAVREHLSAKEGAASQAVRSLSALFAWAVKNDRMKDNPAKGVTKFGSKDHAPWPEALVEEALDDPQVGLAVALFYFTGQRINEVVKMSRRHIRDGYMDVFVQKTSSSIKVAILPELMERLASADTGLTLLVNSNGQPWSQSGLRQKLQAWAKERGQHVVPHGLRKNAVNALFEAGCTAAEVSGITDQSIGMLEHYAKDRNKLRLGQAAIVKFGAAREARNIQGAGKPK